MINVLKSMNEKNNKQKKYFPANLQCRRLSNYLVLILLLFVPSAYAATSAGNISFSTNGQSMWGPAGADIDTTFTVFQLPLNAGGSRSSSRGYGGFDFGYDVSASTNGSIGMDFSLAGTGQVDVNYGGAVTIGYPDARQFQKGSAVTITTALSENSRHIRTSSANIVKDLSMRADLDLEANMGLTIFGHDINFLDLHFDTAWIDPNLGFSLLRIDPLNLKVDLLKIPGLSLDIPGLSPALPAGNIAIENGPVRSGCGQRMISGSISAPAVDIDMDFTAGAGVLTAAVENKFVDLTLDLDAIVTKVVDKKLPSDSPHKGAVPCYVHGEASVSVAGYHYNPSYDTLDMKLDLDISERREFTFDPAVWITLNFSSPVDYCVTNAGQPVPALTDPCWKTAQSIATFEVGRSIHVMYPGDPSPDSVTVAPSFSLSNTFRNKTLFRFQEPLNVKAMRVDLDVGRIVVIPEVCFPEVCVPAVTIPGECIPLIGCSPDIEITPAYCTPAYCTPEVAFPGFGQIGPLYSTNIATSVQNQVLTAFDETWALGGFQPSHVNGNLFTMLPKLSQTIIVTTHPPDSAVYNSSFTVTATGGGSGLPVVISGSEGCSGTGNNTATITMTSGTAACVVRYNQAGNFDYNPAPEVIDTVTALKATTVTSLDATVDFSSVPPSVTSTAIVTSSAGIPPGTVTFMVGGSNLAGCVSVPMVSGVATCSATTLPPGIYDITAGYSGNADYLAGTSDTVRVITQGKMSRHSHYLSPEGWILRAYTKADAPNEVYLEVMDMDNNVVDPSGMAGMTDNPMLIASDAVDPEVSLGLDKASRTARVVYTAAGGRQMVSVARIMGATARIDVTPNPVLFGNVLPGSVKNKTITVTNVGVKPLHITSLGTTVDPFRTVGGTCAVGAPVAVGGSCTTVVMFIPIVAKAYDGSFLISSDGGNVNVRLIGTVIHGVQ
ncbi:MAG: Ig-like domain repeat protein [Nitrospirae bacterium]|nr:Ig-like domain repeat protein [Nitrospirota bacterium]